AERIIATAPGLLAAVDGDQRDAVSADLAAEVAALNARLAGLRADDAGLAAMADIEPIVAALTGTLAALEAVVGRRVAANVRVAALRRDALAAHDEVQRLLTPWLAVVAGQIAA